MNESEFNKTICKKLAPLLTADNKVWKIRDDMQGGVPDNFFLANGRTLWLELKYLKTLPKRETTNIKINLSELQKLWINTLNDNAQNVGVMVGVGQGAKAQAIILTPHEAIVSGISALAFSQRASTGYAAIAMKLKGAIYDGV